MKKEIFETGYFMDIERLVNWTYKNPQYIRDSENLSYDEKSCSERIINKTTVANWRKYKGLPNDSLIEKVNSLIKNSEEHFDKINIAELLFCINNAKDHNRGIIKEQKSITSTGKKVLMLLLLGHIFDGHQNKNGSFTATKERNPEIYHYLTNVIAEKQRQEKTVFYYLPGRVVTVNQLKKVGNAYKNGIRPQAITIGLNNLISIDLVEHIIHSYEGKTVDLYKLKYETCKQFVDEVKIIK